MCTGICGALDDGADVGRVVFQDSSTASAARQCGDRLPPEHANAAKRVEGDSADSSSQQASASSAVVMVMLTTAPGVLVQVAASMAVSRFRSRSTGSLLVNSVDGRASSETNRQRAGAVSTQPPLHRHHRIVHGAGADVALATRLLLRSRCSRSSSVFADQHLAVEIGDAVALAAQVAVDAVVLAAAEEVHRVLDAKPGVGPGLAAGGQGLGCDRIDPRFGGCGGFAPAY